LHVSWCAGGRCGMTCSDEDHGRSRRPGAEDRRWSHRSGTQWSNDQEVRWHCIWSAPCTWRREARVSWLSLKTKIDGLSVVWHQNHWDSFLRFSLKTGGDGFSRFGLKTGGSGSLNWASKPAAMVWWFESQNQFLGLDLKTKRALVYRLHHKIDGGRTTRDTHQDLTVCFAWKQVTLGFFSLASRLVDVRRWVMHVAPSWRLRRNQVKDRRVDVTGCVRLCYP
jgi:hypothetical protein